jgi:peptidoglycan-associated lipoprotein
MKLTKFTSLLGLAVALAVSAGCKHQTPPVTELPKGSQTGSGSGVTPGEGVVPGSTNADVSSKGIAQPSPTSFDNWTKDPEAFKADTVHFDYDSSVVRAGDKSKIAAVADALKATPANAVEIQGHCDERGTDEYNRSLGERRALALREELVRLGVDANHIATISFGRDRPVDTGHSEAAHKKNRRGEFVLMTPPK